MLYCYKMYRLFLLLLLYNCIGGIMVRVLALSVHVVDRGVIGSNQRICTNINVKHAAPRRKKKDLLARNQDNVSEWCDMSIRELLLPGADPGGGGGAGCPKIGEKKIGVKS